MANRTKEQGHLNHQSRRLQRNITRIIITDFLCWVPFLFTCLFHSLEIIDATFLYSVFSVVILPINSCINPLIYDNYIRDRFNHSVRFIKKKAKEKLQQNRSVEMDVIKAPSDWDLSIKKNHKAEVYNTFGLYWLLERFWKDMSVAAKLVQRSLGPRPNQKCGSTHWII